MVCRENKGRSTMIGIQKFLSRMNGMIVSDTEAQSTIHMTKHDGDALDYEAPLTKEEQLDFWRSMRTEIERHPDIPDAEKYRQSKRRPGLVTRIDQEIKRIETGKDENGNELANAQLNSHSHMYAMMRQGASLERQAVAKEEFLEHYARGTGKTFEEAQQRFDEVMNEKTGNPNEFVHKSQVRDDVRQNLAQAGISAQTQANIGVSGRAIHAMEVLETERQASVANQESKPVAGKESRVAKFNSANGKKAKRQCTGHGGCGQFGHERPNCPNQSEVQDLKEASDKRKRFEKTAELRGKYNDAQKMSDEQISETYRTDDPQAWRAKTISEFKKNEANGNIARAEKRLPGALREEREAQERLDAKTDVFHSEVSNVYYHKEAGTLVVERRQKKGEDRPQIIRRCTQAEADDFVARLTDQETLDDALDGAVGGDENKFANKADMEAAKQLTRCPNCGQFASMNTSHKCAVKGGPSEQMEEERRRRRLEARRQARQARRESGSTDKDDNRPLETELMFRNHTRDTVVKLRNSRGEVIATSTKRSKGNVNDVARAVEKGNIAQPNIAYDFTDGSVRGSVSVWQQEIEDENGQKRTMTLMSQFNVGSERSGLKCDCAEYKENYRCKHVEAAGVALKNAYSATRVAPNVVPGENPRVTAAHSKTGEARVAPDMLVMDETHTDMDRVLLMKNARRDAEMESYISHRAEGEGATTLMVQGTTDADGNEVEPPTTWTSQDMGDEANRSRRNKGKVTDLSNLGEVTERLRGALNNMAVELPGGGTENVQFRVNRKTRPGGISIRLGTKYDRATPKVRATLHRALADRMGVSPSAVRSTGLFIPEDRGSLAENLERAAGNADTRRWNGPKRFVSPSAEKAEDLRRGGTNV